MTPAQREDVREVLNNYWYSEGYSTAQALDAIAAIMAPQWLPVAGLVLTPETDSRYIVAGKVEDGELEVEALPAWCIDLKPDYTGYIELPAAPPGKPEGDDAR
jgi:hypothetical protein